MTQFNKLKNIEIIKVSAGRHVLGKNSPRSHIHVCVREAMGVYFQVKNIAQAKASLVDGLVFLECQCKLRGLVAAHWAIGTPLNC